LLWNPISLSQNSSTRRALRQQAQQTHDYATWWATYYGGGPQRTPVWTPPPPQSGRRKWWHWIPLAFIGLIVGLIILSGIRRGDQQGTSSQRRRAVESGAHALHARAVNDSRAGAKRSAGPDTPVQPA
jgi:hypothetical protein